MESQGGFKQVEKENCNKQQPCIECTDPEKALELATSIANGENDTFNTMSKANEIIECFEDTTVYIKS